MFANLFIWFSDSVVKLCNEKKKGRYLFIVDIDRDGNVCGYSNYKMELLGGMPKQNKKD